MDNIQSFVRTHMVAYKDIRTSHTVPRDSARHTTVYISLHTFSNRVHQQIAIIDLRLVLRVVFSQQPAGPPEVLVGNGSGR